MDHPLLKNVKRILLLSVPLDIIPEGSVDDILAELIDKAEAGPIVFLTYAKLMKARHDPEFLGFLHKAALLVPVSKSLENACRFLHLPHPARYEPFSFTIRFLGILEAKRKSLYVLGDDHKAVQTIAGNMRASFPGINLVGRHAGFFSRESEGSILQAIQKATPTLLLVGPGIPGKDKWAYRQTANLPAKLFLYTDDSFRIMSGKKRRPSPTTFRQGGPQWSKFLRNPFRAFKAFSYLWFGIILLVYRLRR